MKPLANHVLRDHVLIGGIAALLLLPVLGHGGSFIFWLSTILIDLDHYLDFFLRTKFKYFSAQSMFRFHEELFKRRHRSDFLALEIFHTLEFAFLFGIISFKWIPALIPVFLGMTFHLFVDVIHLSRYGILHKRASSFVEFYLRRKQIRSRGENPDKVFEEALSALG